MAKKVSLPTSYLSVPMWRTYQFFPNCNNCGKTIKKFFGILLKYHFCSSICRVPGFLYYPFFPLGTTPCSLKKQASKYFDVVPSDGLRHGGFSLSIRADLGVVCQLCVSSLSVSILYPTPLLQHSKDLVPNLQSCTE